MNVEQNQNIGIEELYETYTAVSFAIKKRNCVFLR